MATYFATQLLSIATLIAFTPPTQADYQSLNVPTGITEVNGTDLNETSAQLPGPSLPQCVDVSTNSGWLSLSGPISGQDCVQVLADIQSASNGSEGTPYLFYSEQVYPSGPPHTEQDWKLPIGAETSKLITPFHEPASCSLLAFCRSLGAIETDTMSSFLARQLCRRCTHAPGFHQRRPPSREWQRPRDRRLPDSGSELVLDHRRV